jgi:hypothetical protein
MKEIKLTQGKFAQVDDEDYEYFNQWRWCAHKSGKTYYVIRFSKSHNKKRNMIHLHREIMNTPDNMFVDHIDINGLNCQRHNMRNCTKSQNQMNRRVYGKSKFKGVQLLYNKYIIAQITFCGVHIRLGTFKTKEEAAKAYDEKAKELYGEFANLNFK